MEYNYNDIENKNDMELTEMRQEIYKDETPKGFPVFVVIKDGKPLCGFVSLRKAKEYIHESSKYLGELSLELIQIVDVNHVVYETE